jgi:hypothetical protein
MSYRLGKTFQMHLEKTVGLSKLKLMEKTVFITPNEDVETIYLFFHYSDVRSTVSSP